MRELDYPFDADAIISKKRRLKTELLAGLENGCQKKRVAILGGYTTSVIADVLELFLLNCGIACEFYQSEYNKFFEDAMFPNAALEEFSPDIIYVCTSIRNISRLPQISDSKEEIDAAFESEAKKFFEMWERLSKVYRCPIIQNNFELPLFRLLGNKDASDARGHVNFVLRLNAKFAHYAQSHENFFLCDANYISADYGLKKWSDPFYWHMYKCAVAVPAIPFLSFNVANIIKSIFGKNKKGLVLDLDNTLWGGVVGEDGVCGIKIGPEESEGQAFLEFQRYLKALKSAGILLCVNSKNCEENALAGLRHPQGELRPEDFACIKANWNPKDKNFLEIAAELNLLPESLVFVDDSAAEREIVQSIPGVAAPKMEGVQNYALAIDRAGFFEAASVSQEDLKRSKMYAENAKRLALQKTFSDYGEYLSSLKMKAAIRPFEPLYAARISQLTNKSNQFNLTTKRCTQAEIESIAADENCVTLCGSLCDKFGDNGIVSVLFGHFDAQKKSAFHIDLFLMSCRVLKRGMEDAMMDALAKKCESRGAKEIFGHYFPTAKNAMVRGLYGDMGFEKIGEDESGNATWRLDLPGYKAKNKFIEIEEG